MPPPKLPALGPIGCVMGSGTFGSGTFGCSQAAPNPIPVLAITYPPPQP